jgi:hypothetical protein
MDLVTVNQMIIAIQKADALIYILCTLFNLLSYQWRHIGTQCSKHQYIQGHHTIKSSEFI